MIDKLMKAGVSRRGFLRASPGAAVASQQIAKQAAQIAAQQSLSPAIGGPAYYGASANNPTEMPRGKDPWDVFLSECTELLRGGVVPKHMRAELHEKARLGALIIDPDIEALHSVALGKKRQMQYERCYQRAIQDHISRRDSAKAHDTVFSAIKKRLGVGY